MLILQIRLKVVELLYNEDMVILLPAQRIRVVIYKDIIILHRDFDVSISVSFGEAIDVVSVVPA